MVWFISCLILPCWPLKSPSMVMLRLPSANSLSVAEAAVIGSMTASRVRLNPSITVAYSPWNFVISPRLFRSPSMAIWAIDRVSSTSIRMVSVIPSRAGTKWSFSLRFPILRRKSRSLKSPLLIWLQISTIRPSWAWTPLIDWEISPKIPSKLPSIGWVKSFLFINFKVWSATDKALRPSRQALRLFLISRKSP